MTSTKSEMNKKLGNKKMRSIGRWYISETLGKGGYSWVKKGYDKKTGKCVALKFMAKADQSWAEEQSKQVVTEIECLKQIRHPNVMKLYAYNLNAKYPSAGGSNKTIDTILLVLEYAPGGEIFDILYYTSALEEILARTYFRQAILGLEACHNAGVAHRDIKPQNLLLDARFNLKITDFGLSKVFESDADSVMKTTYVGTRGYQAPELLLEQPYNFSCDIFSMAVVLFILITGYPPFEQAHASDRWFKPIATGNYAKFWRYHHGCHITNNKMCKDLLNRMFCYDPKNRITISQIKKHPWFNGKFLEGKDLVRALRSRYRAMEASRKKDARKIKDFNNSVHIGTKPVPGFESIKVPLFPEEELEGVNDTYTTIEPVALVNGLNNIINMCNGRSSLNEDFTALNCRLKIMAGSQTQVAQTDVSFSVEWWQSREFFVPDDQAVQRGDDEETDHSGLRREKVYCVRMRRVEGSLKTWRSVRSMIFKKASPLLTGLPNWAEKQAVGDAPAKPLAENYYDDYANIDWTVNN